MQAQTKETKGADRGGAMGIVTSVVLSSMFGWIYLVALTSVMADIPYFLDPEDDAGGYAIAQALYNIFRRRPGVCLGIICTTTQWRRAWSARVGCQRKNIGAYTVAELQY
jgi:hypothetical protein